MVVDCESRISPDCIKAFKVQMYDESQRPYLCEFCDEYIRKLHNPERKVQGEFRFSKTSRR